MNASRKKVLQYLGEAQATEQSLVRVLQSQIAMTPRGAYRTALEQHLRQTREHSERVGERRRELGQSGNPLTAAVGVVESVVGQALALGKTPFDLLRACFPAGTVSGAPKIRAMQIISELEGYRRGVYAGAVGYALPGGSLDTCIAIRTLVLVDGLALLQAGGGIVADSDPAEEHQECLNKLAALEAAIELAEQEQR